MPSLTPMPASMLSDIDFFLEQQRGQCIQIYPEAERIRCKWESQNIALEDVVSVLVERAGLHEVALSFDRSAGIDALVENHSDWSTTRRCG